MDWSAGVAVVVGEDQEAEEGAGAGDVVDRSKSEEEWPPVKARGGSFALLGTKDGRVLAERTRQERGDEHESERMFVKSLWKDLAFRFDRLYRTRDKVYAPISTLSHGGRHAE